MSNTNESHGADSLTTVVPSSFLRPPHIFDSKLNVDPVSCPSTGA